MPFYWGDWFKSTDVQSLPRETKCVWFEILGRMWESNEQGYMTTKGKPMSDFAKARALGFGEDVEKYMSIERELEDMGLFSRREDGAIYSRKMLHLKDLREKRRNAGYLGGKKTQAKGQANTEIENENEDTKSKKVVKTYDFESVWKKHPHKLGKKEALGYFNTTVLTDDDFSRVNAAVDNFVKYVTVNKITNKKWIKTGGNWFYEWEDWVEYVVDEEDQEPEKFKFYEVRDSIEKQLCKIAKDPMIEKCMRGIPKNAWYLVKAYLRRKYPDGGEMAYYRVEDKLSKEGK